MRVAFAIALFVVCVAAADYAAMFQQFKQSHGQYATAAEEAKRFGIFVENMKTAEQMQAANPLAKFGVNEFSDMSADEFKSHHNAEKYAATIALRRASAKIVELTAQQVAAAPTSIDWRTKGAVTPVKNQGQCGSCWSFSTTGGIEGQWFLAGNALTSLSEQELVSCDTTDDGCNGGLMDNAFKWLLSAHQGQIVTEASYPYVSGNGNAPKCNLNGKPVGATISGHIDLPTNEQQMAAWVGTNGPLSIAVDATSWQTYTSGIMTNCISKQIDHGVLIVGYDLTNQPPYWIIKNSWAASWGEQGYIRVEYGKDQCLITSTPCSSQVKGGPSPTGPTSGPTTVPPPTHWTTRHPYTTTSAPSSTFTQLVCQDFYCHDGCQKNVLPQNKCLKAGERSSAIATCESDGLKIKMYSDSADCEGSYQTNVEPINQCLADQDGTFVKNEC